MVFLGLVAAYLISEFLFNPALYRHLNKNFIFYFLAHLLMMLATNMAVLYLLTPYWILLAAASTLLHAGLEMIEKILPLKNAELPTFITKHALFFFLTGYGVYYFGWKPIPGSFLKASWLIYVNSFLIVIFFAYSLNEVVYNQALKYGHTYEFESKYFYLSMAERGFLLALLLAKFYFLIPFLFIPRIYLQRLDIFTKYRTDLLIGTSFTFLVFVFLSSVI